VPEAKQEPEKQETVPESKQESEKQETVPEAKQEPEKQETTEKKAESKQPVPKPTAEDAQKKETEKKAIKKKTCSTCLPTFKWLCIDPIVELFTTAFMLSPSHVLSRRCQTCERSSGLSSARVDRIFETN
jgi:archaellum component FlaD/FlaE